MILAGTVVAGVQGGGTHAEIDSEVAEVSAKDLRNNISSQASVNESEANEDSTGQSEGEAQVQGVSAEKEAEITDDANVSYVESNNAVPPVDAPPDRAATETYEVTAYTSGAESTGKSPGDAGYGITASGAEVSEGRTVACPPSLDFGTVVAIEGVGERVCADRGSAITEGRLDVYMSELEDAVEFGRKTLEVEILN